MPARPPLSAHPAGVEYQRGVLAYQVPGDSIVTRRDHHELAGLELYCGELHPGQCYTAVDRKRGHVGSA
jgi:hypothetical protein